ncbi:hypothetical protein FQT07_07590 [Enterococcus hirae]|nr:hypothetical protein [Enterococcus hirae]
MKGGQRVKAPWEQEPEVWQAYQPKSWNNLGTLQKKEEQTNKKRKLFDILKNKKLNQIIVTVQCNFKNKKNLV